MKAPVTYPMKEPVVSFPPGAVWHPSIDANSGEICVQKDFGPTKQLKDIGALLRALLETPTVESPVNGDAAQQMAENYEAFAAEARKRIASQPAA